MKRVNVAGKAATLPCLTPPNPDSCHRSLNPRHTSLDGRFSKVLAPILQVFFPSYDNYLGGEILGPRLWFLDFLFYEVFGESENYPKEGSVILIDLIKWVQWFV